MPRNGSGTYTLPAGNPVVTGTTISSTTQNTTMSDVAAELTNSIAADGQKTPTANLPMGNFKHTGVANANARDQYSSAGQVQDGAFLWAGTAGGTADVITLSPIPSITAYAAGQTFRFIPSGENTTNTTVNVSGLGAKALTKIGATALVPGDIQTANVCEIVYDGTQFQLLNTYSLSANGGDMKGAINYKRSTVAATATTTPLWTQPNGNIQDWTGTPTITDLPAAPQAGAQREVYPTAGTIITNAGNISVQGNANYTVAAGDKLIITAITTTNFDVAVVRKNGLALAATSKIQPITASVSSNALTVTINPTVLDFRSATLTSGDVNTRTISAPISVVVSSGSTLGTVNATLARLAVLAIDNAGTVEVAVMNIAGGAKLDETGVISTTSEGGAGAADSALVAYSTTARSNVPYRLVGYIESTQATAGTWATAPSAIQGEGGQSTLSTAMNAIGSAPMFACRAWVNFLGQGTVAIRGAGNVSSITDNGVGDYSINFAVAMPDAAYSIAHTVDNVASATAVILNINRDSASVPLNVGQFRVQAANAANPAGSVDPEYVTLSVFR